MSKFIITGGNKLGGEIAVGGAKNAVLPLIAATLLTQDTCVLTNVPEIRDVATMVEILKGLGASASLENGRLQVTAKGITGQPNSLLVSQLRASILLLGSLMHRLPNVSMPYPGGDKIGHRSIEPHLQAFRDLGALVESTEDSVAITAKKLQGTKIVLEESSVTATENALLAASLTPGTTVIKLAAMEPHVQQLGTFLQRMGAKVSGLGSPTITVEGVESLHGAEIAVIPDSEEAASLITLAAAVRGDITVTGLEPNYLEDYLLKLRKMNVRYEVGAGFVHVPAEQGQYQATKIQCGLYPKLNSDYIPPMAVLATQAHGESLLYEWMYENRLGYIPELHKMGARAEILDPHRVRITGPTPLHAAHITSFDLRMGMTLVIAALIAEGTSEISDIHHIDRGYQHLERRLRALGADITRVD